VHDIATVWPRSKYHPPSVGAFTRIAPVSLVTLSTDARLKRRDRPIRPGGGKPIYNLRTEPHERASITSNTYYDWLIDHAFMLVPAQEVAGQFLLRSARGMLTFRTSITFAAVVRPCC
jgi:hypothetical protein